MIRLLLVFPLALGLSLFAAHLLSSGNCDLEP